MSRMARRTPWHIALYIVHQPSGPFFDEKLTVIWQLSDGFKVDL